MDTSPLVEFPETEEAYRAWARRNPHGFVINARQVSSIRHTLGDTARMMWHRADCGHIDPDWPERYVTGDATKACSLNPAALAIWAKTRSEPLEYCKHCQATWLNEQEQNRQP